MKPLAPNTLLQDRYLVVHLIGKGGMGEVYLAVDQRLGSAMALKRTYFANDEMYANAFEREARTLARLRHPVLPKVSDHFQENENQYLVMEYIPGDDLSARLEISNKPFPLSWVLFWADQLLEALNYLHTNDPPIIHRDIKPQNLKLTDENHIILLDFGLSKNSLENTKLLSTGSIVGYTPHYAPMEQIRGTGTNASSDLYSLAATLYQLLTNAVPSDTLTRADALLSGLSDSLKPAHELNGEISPAISGVLSNAMELSQDKRFQTARAMQKALRAAYANAQNGASAQTVAKANDRTSAQTVALNKGSRQVENETKPEKSNSAGFDAPAQDQASAKAELPQSHLETAVMPKFDVSQISESQQSESKTDSGKNAGVEQTDSGSLQSDVKTEVVIAGSSPAISEYQENYGNSQNETDTFEAQFEENFDPADDFSEIETPSEESFGAEDDFSADNFPADATVPLITFDKNEPDTDFSADTENDFPDRTDTDFDSVPNRQASAAFAFDSGESFSQEHNNSQTPAAGNIPKSVPKNPPPKQQSSKGKIMAIAGGLFALLILVIGAGGAGWYFYNSSNAVSANDEPKPSPSAVVEQLPEKTPDIIIADTDNSNTETNSESNANSETPEANANSAENDDKTPAAAKPTPKPTRAVTINTPVQRTPTPVRPTPQPKPKDTPRPRILP